MRDHHEGRAALARELQHQREHRVGGAAVQVAGGLVGQHAGRVRHQGAGDRHALAFAAREFGRAVLHAVLQAHGGQHLLGLPVHLRQRQAADPQRHADVVQRAEFGQQVVELVDEAEVFVAQPPLRGRIQPAQLAAHQLHRAAGGRIEAAQHVQQRALARAGGADDRQRLAGVDFQVHPAQHLDVEVALVEAAREPLPGQHHAGVRQLAFTHSAAPPRG